jgi:small subunit ribosomal protein S29
MQQNPPNRSSPIEPFLLATGQEINPIPVIDQYAKHDVRVLETFPDGERRVEVQRIEGISRAEARGLMEYWAKSGLLRARVSDALVGEKWTVSGKGVIGELEKGCVTVRV